MRKLLGLLATAGFLFGTSQPASAAVATLSSASLSITIGNLPPIAVPWNGIGSADVTATSITGLTAGIFNFTGTIPVTDPAAFPIAGIAILGATNGTGNFTGVDGVSGGGAMAVVPVANVCLMVSCESLPQANVAVPFTTGGVNGAGLGGAPIVALGLVNVTANGNPWTTGTATVGTTSATGSPLSGNSVTLVTPVLLSTDIGAAAQLPVFGIMELTFHATPEPGTLLLLASGVAGLALCCRVRG